MKAIVHFSMGFLLILAAVSAKAGNQLSEIEQNLSDSFITTKIVIQFFKNPNLNPLKIYVSTKNGIVRLQGHVKNRQAFVDALTLTLATTGVKEIDTEGLVIKQVNTALTDAYITTKVEAAVLKAKVFDDESIPLVGINATTTDGTVTLSGQLKNEKAISTIIKRVSMIKGVKKIISHLQVNVDVA